MWRRIKCSTRSWLSRVQWEDWGSMSLCPYVLIEVYPRFLPYFQIWQCDFLERPYSHNVCVLLLPDSIWFRWFWQLEHCLYYRFKVFIQWFAQSLLVWDGWVVLWKWGTWVDSRRVWYGQGVLLFLYLLFLCFPFVLLLFLALVALVTWWLVICVLQKGRFGV